MADLKTELEDLTGTIIRGDICPIIAKLLKDTKYPNELLNYLGCEITKKEEQQIQEVDPAPSFMEMFSGSAIVSRR